MTRTKTFRVEDPDQYRQWIRAEGVRLVVTSSGDYRAAVTRIDFHQLWMMRASQSLAQTVWAGTPKGRRSIFFLSDNQQPPVHIGGAEIRAGDLVCYSPEAEHHYRLPEGGAFSTMSLKPEDLAAAGETIIGREVFAPDVTSVVRPQPEALGRVQALHGAIGELAIADPGVLMHDEVVRAIEDSLLRAFVAAVADPATDDERRSLMRGTAIMRRLEDVLEAHADEPLYLIEVCSALRVPERTLRAHCVQHLGMGPHRYLWLRRLHLARRALAKADPSKTTVTTIANEYGFAELGRFSVNYRELFGESPSATLSRAEPKLGKDAFARERALPILHRPASHSLT